MPYADLGHVQLCYELSGPEDGEPMLLIHGLGAQLIEWYAGMIDLLESSGFRLVRFDNRDVGLSSRVDDTVRYTMQDMAEDAVGLMDHLGLESAHVVGQSMGGMIAQELAIGHPRRVRSLVIIYSSPDETSIDMSPETWAIRHEPLAPDRDGRIAQFIRREFISGFDGFDDEWIGAYAARSIDRAGDMRGVGRQEQAIFGSRPRLALLAQLTVPTAVIHGRQDPIIDFRGGVAIATAVPESELHVLAGMRHQLPPHLWPDVVRIIQRTAARASAHPSAAAPVSPPAEG